MGPKWSVGHFGCIVTSNRGLQPTWSPSPPTRLANRLPHLVASYDMQGDARDPMAPQVPMGQGRWSCKCPGTWVCVQMLVICCWLRWKVALGCPAAWPVYFWSWLWDHYECNLQERHHQRTAYLWRRHGWFWIVLKIGSSRTACHYDEYLDRPYLCKSWMHETGGVRISSQYVSGLTKQPWYTPLRIKKGWFASPSKQTVLFILVRNELFM